MSHLIEFILGLQKGFLSREGEFSISFNPQWPAQDVLGTAVWNCLLAALAIGIVIYAYRRDGRPLGRRITLASLRALLLGLVLILLNRPMLTLGQSHTEPSVLAVLLDDSLSMRVRDAGDAGNPQSRLDAAVDLFNGQQQQLLRDLAKVHELRFYRFDATATPLVVPKGAASSTRTADQPASPQADIEPIAQSLGALVPVGQLTQVGDSIRGVLDDLQGQRLAGIVLLTDGRDTPARPLAATIAQLKDASVRIYPIAIGSDASPLNLELQSATAQASAFLGDIVNVKAIVRATGLPRPREIVVRLLNQKTHLPLLGPDGQAVESHVMLSDDRPIQTELQFKPAEVGDVHVVVSADKLPGEIDEDDNSRELTVSVLDAKVNLLYVEGYPRWDYRYLKNEMIRDKTIDSSFLLTSADPDFRQEGTRPITRFPESINEMMDYDVVLFGDVDPRQFSDTQLQLVREFVSEKGGGFGMIAGPRFSPQAFRGTPIEAILPVDISHVASDDERGTITDGFRPVLTPQGEESSIFRFFADRSRNLRYMQEQMPPLFWYCRGVSVKPGVGEAYAQHPTEMDWTSHPAPLLVLGRFGAGRTLFSAIDDSWRWRLYTGESVFDTYWVQQIRYLARGRKLGQRRLMLVASKPAYQLGDSVRVTLRVLDPQLLAQLPEQIRTELRDSAGHLVREEMLQRDAAETDLYSLAFTADRLGAFSLHLPPITGEATDLQAPIRVDVPQLELADPRIDRVSLTQLAGLGRDFAAESARLKRPAAALIPLATARSDLPKLIPSAARTTLTETSQPLWQSPLLMGLFVFLICTEWILRKLWGMV
jgi:uncharacterized membrane protein